MKVQVKKIEHAYNQWGCGYRLLFLIIWNKNKWTHCKEDEVSIHLNRRLNKLVEYWNYHGNNNGRKWIRKTTIYVPIDTLGKITEEDYKAIETESYGYIKKSRLSRNNLYYQEELI